MQKKNRGASGGDAGGDWRRKAAKLLAKGDRKGAAKAFERYLTRPDLLPPILRNAQAAFARRDITFARAMLQDHLAGDPDDPAALSLQAQIELTTGRFDSAESTLRQALNIVPAFTAARRSLVMACLLQGKFDQALIDLEPLLRFAPRNPDYLSLRAGALLGRGDAADAAQVNAGLIAAHPHRADIWLNYAKSLQPLRRTTDAIDAYRKAIELEPHRGEAWWQLANLKIGALNDADIATMRAVLAAKAASDDDRCNLHFALARALEDRGDFGEAMTAYRLANSERLRVRREVPEVGVSELVDRIIKVFTPDFLRAHEGLGDPSRSPIFILGMPRSGSTLVEQILAMHPLVEGMQELPELDLIARSLGSFGSAADAPYPESLAGCDADRLRALGAGYLGSVAAKRKTDRPHFLDKQWSNWLHVGLILLILPNAQIIDTRRDPLACCLSMFRQHFARGASFTYSFDSLAEMYRAYDRLIAHFDALRPGRIKLVRLADLIDDAEATVRALLDHLELPFVAECLRFYDSDRPVFTPSAEQVRKPINRDADALMKGYSPHIDDLRMALGDLVSAR